MISNLTVLAATIWATCWVPLIAMEACGEFDDFSWIELARLYYLAPFWLALAAIDVAIEHLRPRAPASPLLPEAGATAPTVSTPCETRRSPQQVPAVVAADAGTRAA